MLVGMSIGGASVTIDRPRESFNCTESNIFEISEKDLFAYSHISAFLHAHYFRVVARGGVKYSIAARQWGGGGCGKTADPDISYVYILRFEEERGTGGGIKKVKGKYRRARRARFFSDFVRVFPSDF